MGVRQAVRGGGRLPRPGEITNEGMVGIGELLLGWREDEEATRVLEVTV